MRSVHSLGAGALGAQSSMLVRRAGVLLIPGALAIAAIGVHADPPVDPPPCNVVLDPLYCIRVTDLRQFPGVDDRYQVELEFLNWTGTDAAGIQIVMNKASGGGTDPEPFFVNPAFIDTDGRPLTPTGFCPSGACPPAGNQPTTNLWQVLQTSPTQVCFSSISFGLPVAPPIPHPSANGYDGLLDPSFSQATQAQCTAALQAMIPGSTVVSGSPARIAIADSETIDDGNNVLDGFVLDIADWDSGEEVSFDWFLLDDNGQTIGRISASGSAVVGDDYGFGTFNLSHTGPSMMVVSAPGPLLQFNSMNPQRVNRGYDPVDTSDVHVDSPLFWAEDEVGGVDTFPINPIPAGFPGQGTFFFSEPGGTVTAVPAQLADLPPGAGTNIRKDPRQTRTPIFGF